MTQNHQPILIVDLCVLLDALPIRAELSFHAVMVALNQVLMTVELLNDSNAVFFVFPERITQNIDGIVSCYTLIPILKQQFFHLVCIRKGTITVRLRTRRSHILRWAVGALDWYHSIWFLNCSLDDYFNRADCDPDLLPALRAFGEPLRAVCLLRTEQAQAAKVCMLGGVEKPSSLADWASDRPIRFHCTIYCLFHAYLSFLIPCLTSILYADNP